MYFIFLIKRQNCDKMVHVLHGLQLPKSVDGYL